MNILKRELKAGLKPLIFWTIGLFVLVFAGMIKYTGIAVEGASVGELIAQFPRVVQAALGIVGINIETLGGYYAVIAYFAIICVSIYAISLGADALNRESIDKTYEFVFTKPRSRSYILLMKLLAGFLYLLAFCILNFLFSVSATASLKLRESISNEIQLFSIAILLVGILFFALSAFLSAIAKRTEKGMLYGNLCFLFAFVMGIIYDMMENGGLLRILTPIRYFVPSEILAGQLNYVYVILSLVLSIVLLCAAFRGFERKDLNAG